MIKQDEEYFAEEKHLLETKYIYVSKEVERSYRELS